MHFEYTKGEMEAGKKLEASGLKPREKCTLQLGISMATENDDDDGTYVHKSKAVRKCVWVGLRVSQSVCSCLLTHAFMHI